MAGAGKSRDHPPPLPAPLLAKLDNRRMQPFHQGDLDSLCGLYAAINALRLVLAPVRRVKRPEALNWFRTGLEFLGKTGNLQDIIGDGIGPPEWLELMEMLAVAAGAAAGCRVVVVQPLRYIARATRARMHGTIDDAIVCGQPVLITLSGVHDHYSVVSGFTPFSLRLFDSGHLQRLRRSDCGTEHGGDKWRHRINARTMTVLSLTPKPNQAARP